MIKDKRGFMAISIVYSFFIVFMLLLILIMTTYVSNRTQSTIYKDDIKKANTYKTFADYLIDLSNNDDQINKVVVGITNTGYRYQGSNVNNYVWFSDSLWRIIGVMIDDDGNYNVKLVSNDPLPEGLYYDGKNAYDGITIGSCTTELGSSDWSDAQLMMLLNPPEYINDEVYEIEENNVYFSFLNNHGQTEKKLIYQNPGAYFNKNISPACSPAEGGSRNDYHCMPIDNFAPLTDDAIKLIAEYNYHLGRISNTDNKDNFYTEERNDEEVAPWRGKVGLIYPSDYHLANKDGSWLKKDNITFTMTGYGTSENYIVTVRDETWYESIYPKNGNNLVFPALYLKSNVVLLGGDGTESNPYKVGE